jgi:hypothetical protein
MYVPVQDVQTEYRFPWFICEAFSIGKINCKYVDGDGGFRIGRAPAKLTPLVPFFFIFTAYVQTLSMIIYGRHV